MTNDTSPKLRPPLTLVSEAEPPTELTSRLTTVVVATIAELPPGRVVIRTAERRLVRAQTAVPRRDLRVGARVVLAFENGDSERPIIMGRLADLDTTPDDRTLELDADRLLLSGHQEILIVCGKASIRLTRAGTVTVEGVDVSTNATRANRIRGASVDLN